MDGICCLGKNKMWSSLRVISRANRLSIRTQLMQPKCYIAPCPIILFLGSWLRGRQNHARRATILPLANQSNLPHQFRIYLYIMYLYLMDNCVCGADLGSWTVFRAYGMARPVGWRITQFVIQPLGVRKLYILDGTDLRGSHALSNF